MTDRAAVAETGFRPWSDGWRDAAVAVLVASAVVAVAALKGFPMLADSSGDNDNLMRMVEVLDLVSGQGWYDLHQYRMGLPGGFLMHWSRLVDAPIAAIVLSVRALTGSLEAGEAAALVLWPAFLFAAALFLLMRLVRAFGEPAALFPAAVIGALALYADAILQPGALDHHNVQLVLTLATVAFLCAPTRPLAAAGAGTTAALMLAVGMETAPLVALAGLVAAAAFLFGGRAERRAALAFGLAFAGVSLTAFLATVPAARWAVPACDAFTVPQMSVALLAGAGLAAAALLPAANATFARRLAALALLGLVLAAYVVAAFPQCLGDPFAGIDPRLRTYWLDAVAEAQSLPSLLKSAPALVAAYYVTPSIGLAVLVGRMRAGGFDRRLAVVGAFLAVAILVSLWQVRGAFFSIPLAAVPLSLWVGGWRERAEGKASPAIVAGMVGAWLVSFNIVWSATSNAVAAAWADGPATVAAASEGACYRASDYARLAGLPKGTVLAVSNLGAPILRYTPHRALAGPYHRNVAGDLATLDALLGGAKEAEKIVRHQGVTIVALCPGNDETAALAADAPDGLLAGLVAGKLPSWLQPVAASEAEPLMLFRVVAQ